MPIFDMVQYDTTYAPQTGFTNYTGSDAIDPQRTIEANSVFNLCPIESVQMKTNTKINMTDATPWR